MQTLEPTEQKTAIGDPETEIINIYMDRFKELQGRTKKRLYIRDIHEQLIYEDFYKLGFGVFYYTSNRKYRNGCFIYTDEKRTFIKNYFSKMDRDHRHKSILRIYEAIHRDTMKHNYTGVLQ